MQSARLRPEILCEEMPAPQRIAPYSSALSADVSVNDEDVGTGRIVLLHDPAGNEAWGGTFRLGEVGWSWLVEALSAHGAEYAAPSGTVTKVASQGFGSMAGDDVTAQLEIRASWTPTGNISDHVEAWAELLCTAAGLPPVPEGVAPLPSRRGQRGRP
jgi:hypothetical protein